MGEIQPKRCEGSELTKDQLADLEAEATHSFGLQQLLSWKATKRDVTFIVRQEDAEKCTLVLSTPHGAQIVSQVKAQVGAVAAAL